MRVRIDGRSVAGRACIVAALLFTSTLGAQAPATPRGDTLRLSLPDAIRTALQEASAVRFAREDERIAAARVLESYGRFLPAASASALAFGQSGTSLLSSSALVATDAQYHGLAVGASASYNVFNGFRDRATLRASIAQRDASSLTVARVRQEIAYDVTGAYFRVVLDDRLTTVARTIYELSRNRESQLKGLVEAGTRAPPDLYRQQAQTSADQAAVIAAVVRGRSDRVALLRRLRIDPSRALLVDATPDEAIVGAVAPAAGRTDLLPRDVAPLTRRALDRRADVAAAIAFRRAADASIVAARGGALPRVALGFDVVDLARVFDRSRQNGVDLLAQSGVAQRGIGAQLGGQFTGVFSLGVTVPLFDRYLTRSDVERAEALAERTRVAESDTRDRVVAEVATASDDIQAADQTSFATRDQVEAAERAFAAVSGRYDVGMATFVDVATAQTALALARNAREEARIAQLLARERLSLAMGENVMADVTTSSPR